MSSRPSLRRLRELAELHGGECLADRYVNLDTVVRWRCASGHTWETLARQVWTGAWCPTCANGGTKHTLDEMRAIAQERGGDCISDEYARRLRWRCAEGHEWEASVSNVVHQETWCPYCHGFHKTVEDMQALAKKRGGQCLSEEYLGNQTKLRWRCANGHEWDATPCNVKAGTWCPRCRGYGRTIDDMRAIASKRGGACLSRKYVDSQTKLRWLCEHGHEWKAPPQTIVQGHWCPGCRGLQRTIKDMRLLAQERGGQCLSKAYMGIQVKLRWRCAEGHEWEANPNNVINGTWCPWCSGRGKKTIKDMRELVAGRGGKCLSRTYINNKTKLRWRCIRGHEWDAPPNSIARGTWCPGCAKERIRHGR